MLLPVVVLLLGGCAAEAAAGAGSGAGSRAASGSGAGAGPAAGRTASGTGGVSIVGAPTSDVRGTAGPDGSGRGLLAAVPAGSGLVATAAVATLEVRSSPDGPVTTTMANPLPDGSPLVFRVIGDRGAALLVQLPVRPNGSTGWVRSDQVTLRTTPYRLVLHRSRHRLDVERNGTVTATYPVGIGTSVNPTPPGTYFLTELLAVPDPHGGYGPYAFGLSAFSPTLTSFAGGPGQLGLHGTNEPERVGTDVSHGCLRVTNEVITRLAHEVPLGSPLEILP